MSLSRYKNINEILASQKPSYAVNYDERDLQLLKLDVLYPNLPQGDTRFNSALEIHIYDTLGNYLDSQHELDYHAYFQNNENIVQFDVRKAFDLFNIRRGNFLFALNYHRNILGSSYTKPVYIDGISPDRTELRIAFRYSATEYREVLEQRKSRLDRTLDIEIADLQLSITRDIGSIALNFGENRIIRITNARIESDYIYIKLYEALPFDLDEKDIFWIVQELTDSYLDFVNFDFIPEPPTGNVIRPANFDLDLQGIGSIETSFQTWNDLLTTNTGTSQKIIDTLFSGSESMINLGIDYTAFDNFVNYSSAQERIENFYYKLQLVEYYDGLSGSLSGISGDTANNVVLNQTRRDAVVSSFDAFERWLYFQPTSSLFTHGVSGSFIGAEGYALTTWPKYVSNGKYVNHHSTSSLGLAWYNGFVATASLFDEQNNNALAKTIPEHIRIDENNDQYVLFVNMIGHHFDLIWTYINHLSKVYSKEEHPALGVPKDLLYSVASSMGWNLVNGKQASSLWRYKLGTDENARYNSTGTLHSKSDEDITTEVWRRIVNNLPYLLKTKGTDRSIKALMSTYGIPQTLISIKEYGGPAISTTDPDLITDEFYYALQFDGNAGTFRIPRGYVSYNGTIRPPDTIEFRFKPERTADSGSTRNILSFRSGSSTGASGWAINYVATSSYQGSTDYGRVTLSFRTSAKSFTVSSSLIPIFDGDFYNVRLYSSTPLTASAYSSEPFLQLDVQKAADHIKGKILHEASATLYLSQFTASANNYSAVTGSWSTSGSAGYIQVGGTGTGLLSGINSFSGSFHGYKEYMEIISDDIFDQHTLNPTSYAANNPTGSYFTLYRYFPLGLDQRRFDHNSTTFVSSSHPNPSFGVLTSSFSGWTSPASGYSYDSDEETYYMYGPQIVGTNVRSQKIRFDTNTSVHGLAPDARSERSAFDNAPLDSNKVQVAFSYQDQISKDIYNHMGRINLDTYFGLPLDEFEPEYTTLRNFATKYWQKYRYSNDVNDFIRVFSLFDFAFFESLKNLMPVRVNLVSGIVIEPGILERSKVQVTRRPEVTRPQYEVVLYPVSQSLGAEYTNYEGIVSASSDIQVLGESYYNTDSNVYEGSYFDTIPATNDPFTAAEYKHISLIRSGSGIVRGWITSSNHPLEYSPTGSTILDSRKSYLWDKVIYYYGSPAISSSKQSTRTYQLQKAASASLGMYYSRSLAVADYHDDEFAGSANAFYLGSKLTGPDFNIPTTNTIDGGPVVEFYETNPNQIIATSLTKDGNLRIE